MSTSLRYRSPGNLRADAGEMVNRMLGASRERVIIAEPIRKLAGSGLRSWRRAGAVPPIREPATDTFTASTSRRWTG